MGRKKIDIKGQTFNHLTAIKRVNKKKNKWYWLFKCICGKEKIIRSSEVKNGNTKSCGCIRKGKKNKNIKSKYDNYGGYSFGYLYNKYKSSAKKRNIQFNLNHNDFFNLIKSNCFYCGIQPLQKSKYKNVYGDISICIYNGIDRKDNKKGYNIKNCVSCCTVCNRAKLDMDYTDFLLYIKRLISYNNENNEI